MASGATASYGPLATEDDQPSKRDEYSVPISDAIPSVQDLPPPTWKIVASVSFYMVAALTMVMSTTEAVLNTVAVPLFFLWLQLVLAVAWLHVCAAFRFFDFRVPMFDRLTIIKLLPLAGVNASGLALNTICLQYIDASFYQVARGMLLPFTVALSFVILDQRPSRHVLYAVIIVCLGFGVGVASQHALKLSIFGVLLGAFSSFFSSLHAIYVKKFLPVVSDDPLTMAYFSNLLSSALLSPLVLFLESDGVTLLCFGPWSKLKVFLIGSFVTGTVGFLICVAGYISIQVTSPTTHMISSAVRGVIQTALGVLIFKDVITFGRIASILIILGGSILYTYIRGREIEQQKSTATTRGHTVNLSTMPR